MRFTHTFFSSNWLFRIVVVTVCVAGATLFPRSVLAQALGEDFTLIVIPDTQNEAEHHQSVMHTQFQWMADQYRAGKAASIAKNVVFATSVGDIVNDADSKTQYKNAAAAYDRLDVAGVPYSVSPGNHDLDGLFNTYFGPARFSGKPQYQGPMRAGQNENNYSFFSAGGMEFVVINLTFEPSTSPIEWADAVLKAHPTRRGIVVQHDILNTDNSWLNQRSFSGLRDNSNLFLMLSGHMHTDTDGSAYRLETGTDGHPIHVLMTDYQDFANGGNGYLRLLRFSPANDKIYASIYSPTVPGYLTNGANFEQFEMSFQMPDAPVAPPARGDFNKDGVVSVIDLELLRQALGTTNATLNLTGPTILDLYDYNELLKLL